jgi:hypothetical protein
MTLLKRTLLLVLAIATTATVPFPVSADAARPPAAMQSPENDHTLVGAWTTDIRLRNCETGEIQPPPPSRGFGLVTFHRGGTMSEYGIGPGQTPALRGPGHGEWQQEPGRNRYSYTFIFTRYDANGLFAGSTRVRSALVVDSADAFTANSAVEAFDGNGNTILTACTTVRGTRFP